MDPRGAQLDVVQGEGGVIGRHGPRGRVVGLVVAVGVVLLHLAVVGEDVGRDLGWGDTSAAVSDIFACVLPKQPAGQEVSRQSVIAQNKDGRPPPPQEAMFAWVCFVWIVLVGQEA